MFIVTILSMIHTNSLSLPFPLVQSSIPPKLAVVTLLRTLDWSDRKYLTAIGEEEVVSDKKRRLLDAAVECIIYYSEFVYRGRTACRGERRTKI